MESSKLSPGPRPSRAKRVLVRLLGERPAVIPLLVTPTLIAIALDLCMRPRSLWDFPPKELLNYTGSTLAACGFWGGPLWIVSRLFLVTGRARPLARAGLAVFFGGLFFPFAFFAYGGQVLYYRVFHAYIARDTVRLGVQLRGTLGAWLAAWGGRVAIMAIFGIVATLVVAAAVRKAAAPLRASWPIIPVLGFGGALYCFWIDFVESRSLQAAPPDTCFIHGVVTATRLRATRKVQDVRGVSLRTPDPLPELAVPEHRPNVIVILSESVRADAMCSAPIACKSRFLEEVAPERVPLGVLTSQASGTFTACMILWSGLPPDVGFATAHKAPLLWELAHAVGYRTGYLTSQNLRYEDLAAYVRNAGIDVLESATELGDTKDPHVGAPDERATEQALAFIRGVPAGVPYFALVHLSNTHWPYRIDPALQPFAPHNEDPLGDYTQLHNHYRNSVLMQERTVAAFLRELRAMPNWDDTVVLFLSDHGEEFREHGRLYHLNYLYDEEVRVPGWLLAGPRALTAAQKDALADFAPRRTYTQDVQATVVDLFGLFDQRRTLPYAELTTGRSLLRPPVGEPAVLLSTTSGVWEDDDPQFGVMRGRKILIGAESHTWWCFDTLTDPHQYSARAPSECGDLSQIAKAHFPQVP